MRKTFTAMAIAAALALGSLNVASTFAYSFDEKMKKSDDKKMKEDKKSDDKKMKEDKSMKEDKKSSKAKSLYSRLGGKKAITAVVDEFVGIVAADNRINKFFADAAGDPKRLAAFKGKLVDQICQASGGPCKYKGQDMVTAHKGMNITDADFGALVEDLVAALNKLNVPKAEQDELLGLLGPMKGDIVGK
jgi:hemoglobin